MQGTPDYPGIVPRSVQELYHLKHKMESSGHFRVNLECYMVQLYADNLSDCFVPSTSSQKELNRVKLEIREDPQTGMISI